MTSLSPARPGIKIYAAARSILKTHSYGEALMEQIICRYCKTQNNAQSTFCSYCNVELDKVSEKGGDGARAAWIVAVGVIVLVVIGATFASTISNNSARNSSDNSVVADAETPPAPVDPLDGHCAGLNYAIDETTSVLGGGGSTSTLDDILKVLKKNGDVFAGYSHLITEPNAASVVQDMSTEMLQIRVGLTTGADIHRTALVLQSDFQTIQNICG
jgi:hypothetical protein